MYCLICDEEGCIKCGKNKYLNENKSCIDRCPQRSVEINERCVECKTKDDCLKCDSRNLEKCRECVEPLNIYEGECYEICPDGFYSFEGYCLSIITLLN